MGPKVGEPEFAMMLAAGWSARRPRVPGFQRPAGVERFFGQCSVAEAAVATSGRGGGARRRRLVGGRPEEGDWRDLPRLAPVPSLTPLEEQDFDK
jgi:hypothetical protein